MNVFSLTGLIALLAIGVTIISGLLKRPDNWAVHYLRNFLGTYFVFSGVVKAIDPIGTAIKMEEYFTIFTEYIGFLTPLWDLCASLALPISIFMIVLEIALGVSLILGTLRNTTLWLYAGLVLFFTVLTGFSHLTGKVTDCGCFGDFVKLKPFESFMKDIFLTIVVFMVIYFRDHVKLVLKRIPSLTLLGLFIVGSLAFSLRNYYNLPIKDFRAYKIGTNVIEGRSTEGLDPGETQTFYTLVNGDQSKEVSSEDYMSKKMWEDKAWVINKEKTRSVVIREPELPKVKDFYLFDNEGTDHTDSLLNMPGYQFIVAAHNVKKLNNDGFGEVKRVVKAAKAVGIPSYGVTASPLEDANAKVDGLCEFYILDATPIKTMIRANPGMVLLKDGILIDKWHAKHLPSFDKIKQEHGIK